MYKIKVSYSTGNSFGSHDTDDYLELSWKDLDIAKENLIYIKEHYDMYMALNGYASRKSKGSQLELNKDKDWFVNVPKLYCISQNRAIDENQKERYKDDWEYRVDEYYAESALKLKADNGNYMQMSAFWCGYFESLQEVEIVLDKSDMKISFY